MDYVNALKGKGKREKGKGTREKEIPGHGSADNGSRIHDYRFNNAGQFTTTSTGGTIGSEMKLLTTIRSALGEMV